MRQHSPNFATKSWKNIHWKRKLKFSDTSNKLWIKDCHVNSQTFLNYLRSFDWYSKVPFEGVTAFPNGYDTKLNIQNPTSTAGYERNSPNSDELRQELWKQVNINDDLENKINTLKKEVWPMILETELE